MTKYLVAKVENEELLQEISKILMSKSIQFTVSSSPVDVQTASLEFLTSNDNSSSSDDASLESLENLEASTSGSSDKNDDILPTGTAEIVGSDILNIDMFCRRGKKQRLDPEEPDYVKPKRDIKRYRRQLCNLCMKTYIVPFPRAKMCHAAVHSDYKRFACLQCPKRSVQELTVRQHVKNHHREIDGGGSVGIGYKDEMSEDELINLYMLTERCFPGFST